MATGSKGSTPSPPPAIVQSEEQAELQQSHATWAALEQSLRGLRADWEREVNDLIDGAKTLTQP